MTVLGECLLRGKEAPICRWVALSREACCFPGDCVGDVTKRLTSLVQSADEYLLLVHGGTNDTVCGVLGRITEP